MSRLGSACWILSRSDSLCISFCLIMSHFCFNPSCSVSFYICNPTNIGNIMNCFAGRCFNAIAQWFVGGASKGSSEKILKSCPINMVTESHDLMINSNFLWRTAPKLTKGKTGLQIDDITLRNNVYKYKLQPCRIQIPNEAVYKIQHIVWGYKNIRKKVWDSNLSLSPVLRILLR